MAKTTNYQWDLPSPSGIQTAEIGKIASAITAIDVVLKGFSTSLTNHTHRFADLTDRPSTLEGYGIEDGMTAGEIAAALQSLKNDLVNGSGAALDTLKELADALGNDPDFATTVSNALGVRVRVDAGTSFSLAQKAQARSNIDALGTVDKGKANGVAGLDSTGKVPSAQLPELTTPGTVGAAIAASEEMPGVSDGDHFAGLSSNFPTVRKFTWGNIKSWLRDFFDAHFVQQGDPKITAPITNFLASSFQYICWASTHVAFLKKNGVESFYWRRNDTGQLGGGNESTLMELFNDGSLRVSFELHVGGGASIIQTDGNIRGGAFGGGYLTTWITDQANYYATLRASEKTAPQNCSHSSDTVEFGAVDVGYNNVTADIPNPYVMTGLRSRSGSNQVYLRGKAIKNTA